LREIVKARYGCRMLFGRVEILSHDSRLLADNPLGDPPVREVGVYLPPSYDRQPSRRFPVAMFLPGYTGTGLQLLNRQAWSMPLDKRLDRLIDAGRAAETIVILPDCFTRYGGSQYVDSPAIGRYQSYLADELIPLVDGKFRTIPKREARCLIGKSSGGYGALVMGMMRPDVFCAIGSHAGDAAFDLSYQKEFGRTLLTLEKKGGIAGFLKWFDELPMKPGSAIEVMSNLCCAAAWSPSAKGPYGYGVGFDLPFNPLTGALLPDIWARWLAWDPVRMLAQPQHLAAMRSHKKVFLDAGLADEYFLQLGARQLAAALSAAGIPHVHEEFDGGHMNTQHRYDRSFELLTRTVADS
jgi:enterochelin esterase family protein